MSGVQDNPNLEDIKKRESLIAGTNRLPQALPRPLTIALSAKWHTYPDRFHWIVEHGFALEYSPNPEAFDLLPEHIAPFLKAGIPIRYHGFFPGYEIGHHDPAMADRAMHVHIAVLEAMHGLGEQVITLHAGVDPGDQIDSGRVVENLAKLVEHAYGLGITVCLENLRRGPTSHPENIAAWARASGTMVTVAYGLRRRRWTEAKIKAKVVEALHLVRLSDYEERRIHELSGGQQQRIALARSLVIEPKLLLLDEPLSNLDARLRANMRDEIRHIQRTLNITTIYVTHDQEEAMSIADRIAVMNRGLVEQIGPPREIYEQPATQFVADFIGRINFLHGRIVEGSLLLLGKRFPILSKEWPEGTEVICAIRPERLRIQQASSSLVHAIVQDATYFGAVVRYHVVLKSGDSEVPN